MSFNILSLITEEYPILLKGNKSILTSFSRFFSTLKKIRSQIFNL